MIPATVRPFPTPAPSPIRNPALWPFWRITSCCWRKRPQRQLHTLVLDIFEWKQTITETERLKVKRTETEQYLTGVDDGLQLQGGQQARVNGAFWNGQCVGDVRRRNAGQCVGLHYDVRVGDSNISCTHVNKVFICHGNTTKYETELNFFAVVEHDGLMKC